MSAPVLSGAGGSTPERLWTPEVNMGTLLAPVWTPIQYVENCDFNPDEPANVDATVFGDAGFSGQDKLGAAWSATLTLNRMVVPGSSPPIYDPAQEYLRTHSIGVFGAANRIQFRIYEFDLNDVAGVVTPRVESYMGFACSAWPGTGGGGQADARMVTVPLLGKGKLNQIAHPYALTPVVPVVYTAVPGTGTTFLAAGGGQFRITGQGFLAGTGVVATTGVKFLGTNATSWTVWSDTEITGVYPAHAAGSGVVTVTTSIGASTVSPTVTYV